MATKPTVGGSDGSWGTELNAHIDVSLDADGKIDDGAAQTTSAAPTADAELANKKYVDDQILAASGVAEAWVRFNSAGTISQSYNVTSVNKDSTGTYTVTWDTDFAAGTYAIVAQGQGDKSKASLSSLAAGSVVIKTYNSADTLTDMSTTVIAFGAQ